MERLFNYDNKVFQAINKLVDCFFVSVLWMICCIPIVTVGASTTAMYYVVNKVLRGGRDYIWSSFWKSFKSNFKQSTILWMICLAIGILLGIDAYITYHMLAGGVEVGVLYYVFLIMIACFILWMTYIFSYTARFENTTKQILKNCAIIAIANLPKTILLGVIMVACLFLAFYLPFLFLFMPALCTLAMNLLLEGIYRKYMSPEDLEKEKELQMETRR